MVNSKMFIRTTLSLAIGAASSVTWAQTGGPQIEEIVISAQKRSESIQDIPRMVQVVTMSQMENNNSTSIEDLVKLIPSMNGDNSLGMGGKTSMRGVGTAAPNIGAESKVGIVVDGVPIPSRANGLRTLIDIEQIEVLPGPQGTLAGRNATGGLINMVTTRPDLEGFTANVQAKVTDDHEQSYGAFLTGPISANVAFSLSLQDQFVRGQGYNLARNSWDVEKDLTSIRGKLLWTPDAETDVIFSYMNTGEKRSGGGNQGHGRIYTSLAPAPSQMWSALERVNNGAGRAVPNNSPVGKTTFDEIYPGLYEQIGLGNNKYYTPYKAGQDRSTDMATLTLDRDYNGGTVTIIGSWLNEDFPNKQVWADRADLTDLDVRPDFDGFAHIVNYAKQSTLEARFASNAENSFHYIVGAFASTGENRYDYERRYLPFAADRRFGTDVMAAFASGTYEIGTGTTVRAGIRYEQDDIDYSWIYRTLPAVSKVTSTGLVLNYGEVAYPSTSDSFSDSYINYDFSVQHRFTDDMMIYANYASANQGPIYDAEFIEGSQRGTPLEPLPAEEVTSVEVGIKASLLDNRMTVNLNAFDMDFTNYQAITNVTDPTNPTSQPILKTYAAGSVISRGIELTSSAFLTENFRLDLAGIYNLAEIADWPNAPCYGGQTAADGCVIGAIPPGEFAVRSYQPNIKGNRLAEAAKQRITAIGTYSGGLNIFGGTEYDFSVTLSHTGEVMLDQLGNPESLRPARTDVDVNLSFMRGPLSVSLFAINVTEDAELTYAAGFGGALIAPGFATSAAMRPNLDRNLNRYFGIRTKYNFGQ